MTSLFIIFLILHFVINYLALRLRYKLSPPVRIVYQCDWGGGCYVASETECGEWGFKTLIVESYQPIEQVNFGYILIGWMMLVWAGIAHAFFKSCKFVYGVFSPKWP